MLVCREHLKLSLIIAQLRLYYEHEYMGNVIHKISQTLFREIEGIT